MKYFSSLGDPPENLLPVLAAIQILPLSQRRVSFSDVSFTEVRRAFVECVDSIDFCKCLNYRINWSFWRAICESSPHLQKVANWPEKVFRVRFSQDKVDEERIRLMAIVISHFFNIARTGPKPTFKDLL